MAIKTYPPSVYPLSFLIISDNQKTERVHRGWIGLDSQVVLVKFICLSLPCVGRFLRAIFCKCVFPPTPFLDLIFSNLHSNQRHWWKLGRGSLKGNTHTPKTFTLVFNIHNILCKVYDGIGFLSFNGRFNNSDKLHILTTTPVNAKIDR